LAISASECSGPRIIDFREVQLESRESIHAGAGLIGNDFIGSRQDRWIFDDMTAV
jgi:hypothetical protein